VRSAITVDPVSAQATTQTDPLPQFVEGTPLHYRTINVQLDKPDFALNPTSCAHKETSANFSSTDGQSASATSPFAATGCATLGFPPQASSRLKGGPPRGNSPRLSATIRPGTQGANIGAFSVALPHSEFLEQGHIGTVCTRVQFKANQCPAA